MTIRDVVWHVIHGVVFGKLFEVQNVVAECGNNPSDEVLEIKLIENRLLKAAEKDAAMHAQNLG